MMARSRATRARRAASKEKAGFLGTLRPSGVAGVVFGSLLLWRGKEMFAAIQQREPSAGEGDAVVVLGVRHLGQGVLQLIVPRHLGFLHAGIDGIHAASMVAMAAKDHTRSRATLASGGIAAISGLLATHAAVVQHRSRS